MGITIYVFARKHETLLPGYYGSTYVDVRNLKLAGFFRVVVAARLKYGSFCFYSKRIIIHEVINYGVATTCARIFFDGEVRKGEKKATTK